MAQHQTRRALFSVSPVMDLRLHATGALQGAAYHMEAVKKLMSGRSTQASWINDPNLDSLTKSALADEQNRFLWHVRAFFWELSAMFDTMLQWANQTFELGLKEDQVRWKKIAAKKSPTQPTEWARRLKELQDLHNSDLFYEISQYRNFAHRAFALIHNAPSLDGKPPAFTFLEPARVGQRDIQLLESHLRSYLEHMRRALTIMR